VPDGHFEDAQGHARAVFEVKHNSDAPAECIRQGAAAGTNLAVAHLSLGVSIDDVLVPIIASTGYLMQIGVVFMLKPSFPVFVMLSHVLDLTCDLALVEAARLLCCIRIVVSQPLVCGTPRNVDVMELSCSEYHCKPLKDFFVSTGNIQSSLFHFFKVMARLHSSSDCRLLVVFPICIREFEDDVAESMIVFPKLGHEYQIGLPDDIELRYSFLQQLENAIVMFHKAGVAHIDLYLSNIMWCQKTDKEVKLKIVDWDAAQFTNETLSTETQNRLLPLRDEVWKTAMANDCNDLLNHEDKLKYYDISLLRVVQKYIEDESLRNRDKNALDQACVNAQQSYVHRSKILSER
jgi:hypothetical protein